MCQLNYYHHPCQHTTYKGHHKCPIAVRRGVWCVSVQLSENRIFFPLDNPFKPYLPRKHIENLPFYRASWVDYIDEKNLENAAKQLPTPFCDFIAAQYEAHHTHTSALHPKVPTLNSIIKPPGLPTLRYPLSNPGSPYAPLSLHVVTDRPENEQPRLFTRVITVQSECDRCLRVRQDPRMLGRSWCEMDFWKTGLEEKWRAYMQRGWHAGFVEYARRQRCKEDVMEPRERKRNGDPIAVEIQGHQTQVVMPEGSGAVQVQMAMPVPQPMVIASGAVQAETSKGVAEDSDKDGEYEEEDSYQQKVTYTTPPSSPPNLKMAREITDTTDNLVGKDLPSSSEPFAKENLQPTVLHTLPSVTDTVNSLPPALSLVTPPRIRDQSLVPSSLAGNDMNGLPLSTPVFTSPAVVQGPFEALCQKWRIPLPGVSQALSPPYGTANTLNENPAPVSAPMTLGKDATKRVIMRTSPPSSPAYGTEKKQAEILPPAFTFPPFAADPFQSTPMTPSHTQRSELPSSSPPTCRSQTPETGRRTKWRSVPQSGIQPSLPVFPMHISPITPPRSNMLDSFKTSDTKQVSGMSSPGSQTLLSSPLGRKRGFSDEGLGLGIDFCGGKRRKIGGEGSSETSYVTASECGSVSEKGRGSDMLCDGYWGGLCGLDVGDDTTLVEDHVAAEISGVMMNTEEMGKDVALSAVQAAGEAKGLMLEDVARFADMIDAEFLKHQEGYTYPSTEDFAPEELDRLLEECA